MSDNDDEKSAPDQSAPRKSPGAAASRARRIGGRARPAPLGGDAASASEAAAAPPAPPAPPPPPAPPAGEPAGFEPAEPPPGAVVLPGWLRWAPAGVLSGAALVMAILLIVFSHGVWWSRPSAQSVRQEILAAAKTCIVDTNTYKYTALDDYETKALRCATGEFRNQLRNTIEKLVKKNAPKIKAQQTTQINSNSAGIEAVTADGRQWTVLVFGQLQVTNVNYPKGRTDPFGAQVRMEKDGGKWLIASLSTVSTPVG